MAKLDTFSAQCPLEVVTRRLLLTPSTLKPACLSLGVESRGVRCGSQCSLHIGPLQSRGGTELVYCLQRKIRCSAR